MEERKVKLDDCGNAILSVDEGKDALLYGNSIANAFFGDEEEVKLFNANAEKVLGSIVKIHNPIVNEKNVEAYHASKSRQWIVPDEYKKINLEELLLSKCNTQEEIDRVKKEYQLYEDRDLIPVLQFLLFLVDFMRENKIVWGVGRGSSVASYILYLLGVHKVDSLKYDLPIDEFFK